MLHTNPVHPNCNPGLISAQSEVNPVILDLNCLHAIFEETVVEYGSRVAVSDRGTELTYEALNAKANQLARYLRAKGITHGDLVAICLDRSSDLIVAILGVLKAGAGYVPLDHRYPRERLGFMVQDSQSAALITTSDFIDELFTDYKQAVVYLDEAIHLDEIASLSEENLNLSIASSSIAYVIYTSGSTGEPKGVLIPHRNVAGLLRATEPIYAFNSQDAWPFFHSEAFDFSVWEIFGALLYGGKLVIVPYLVSRSPADFAKLLEQEKVTVLNQTPSAFKNLLTYLSNTESKPTLALRYIIFGGESLDFGILTAWTDVYGYSCPRIFNMYGITETTVHVTYAELTEAVLKEEKRNWIGRPIPGLSVHILDENRNKVNPGEEGEMYVEGYGVAQGYLNRLELTADPFIQNPYSKDPQSRLYRTGDRARWLPDGTLEFLGRKDNQVKIRGFRIELGEIENVISQHPAVDQALVIVQGQEHPKLLAFVNEKEAPGELGLERVQIADWAKVYDRFATAVTCQDPYTDFIGWNSSYTGEPIPQLEMIEWAEQTTKTIAALKPKNLLEIGSGHGMFLFRLAPYYQNYTGLDVSEASLACIQEKLHRYDDIRSRVRLHQKDALDFLESNHDTFDTVVMNSVIQYFPSLDYLTRALTKTIEAMPSKGKIFIGDIRNFHLLQMFHSSVKFSSALPTDTVSVLKSKISKAIAHEQELLIAPEYFRDLKNKITKISHVEVLLKEGSYSNELNTFRYDVVLHIDSKVFSPEPISWLDWNDNPLFVESIRKLLKIGSPRFLGIKNAPNKRLSKEAFIDEKIHELACDTASELETLIPNPVGCNLNKVVCDLQSLCNTYPYVIESSCLDTISADKCHIVFKRQDVADQKVAYPEPSLQAPSNSAYANEPFKRDRPHSLSSSLKTYLKSKLPEYMLPSAVISIGQWPLTENGKVNKAALLKLADLCEPQEAIMPPRTEIERKLLEIWRDLLDVSKIGILDNFFDVGGDSLLVINTLTAIESTFDVSVDVEEFFKSPTIMQLSEIVQKRLDARHG